MFDGEHHDYGLRIDETNELNLGPVDAIMGLLTLPLLFWFMMYAVSGGERFVATPAARMRVYLALLAVEIVIVLALVAWFQLR